MSQLEDYSFAKKCSEFALEVGFEAAGIVDIEAVLDHSLYKEHLNYYEEWIQKKYHGEMGYLERGAERRKNPRHLLENAESILAVCISYPRSSPDDGVSPRYARYLYGPDYHDWMKDRLSLVLEKIRLDFPEVKAKICVDTSALLERTWAQFAGLGWIGKNTLLIHPKLGSYLFLGFIIFDRKSGTNPNLLPNYCGNCTRCLDQCPTKALVASGKLDSKRCIAYLTLEKRGDYSNEEKTLPFRRFIAGCDICQETCPYNFKPTKNELDDPALLERSSHLVTDLLKLSDESEESYRSRVKGTALSRVKFKEAQRNLKVFLDQNKELEKGPEKTSDEALD